MALLSSRESKSCAKHVNTCSDDFGAPGRVGLRVLWSCHMNIGLVCEPIDVKIIVLRAPEAKIINVHVFPHQLGQIYCIPHI
jgi:hypothetical protein